MADPIYLDYNATTPVDPDVLERMLPYFTQHFGNPASKRHAYGWAADEGVTIAREQVATLLGAEPHEVVFTSGATEAINLGLKGFAEANQARGRHIITVETEHKAVLASTKALARAGWEITFLPVDRNGTVTPAQLKAAIRTDTALVAAMWANNEIGTIHPVAEFARVAHDAGAGFLCDATQAVGKVPVSVKGIDLLTCSAHKFYGPKGVGALVINRGDGRFRIQPQQDGGAQESGTRGGTLNVPGIVGMGAAAAKAHATLENESNRMRNLRDRFEGLIVAAGIATINAGTVPRLPNTSNLTFHGVRAADLLDRMGGIALSTGSACSSGTGKPGHVLQALGMSDDDGSSTVRVSLGRFTTREDIETAASTCIDAVRQLETA